MSDSDFRRLALVELPKVIASVEALAEAAKEVDVSASNPRCAPGDALLGMFADVMTDLCWAAENVYHGVFVVAQSRINDARLRLAESDHVRGTDE